jgi:hypothetical protein
MRNYARTSGILSIISGILGIGYGVTINLAVLYLAPASDSVVTSALFIALIIFVLFLFVAAGGLAIAGGMMALDKIRWRLALTGTIAAIFTFFPVGIPALIFLRKAKPEFVFGEIPPGGFK